MADLQPGPAETKGTALHHNRLGVLGIVFFVVAAAAPLVGMTGAAPVAMVIGNGAGVPGAYLVAGITLLLFSFGYAAMSNHVTNTGAFFAYIGRGLGVAPGVGSSIVSLFAYIAIQLSIYGFFGVVVAGTMAGKFGIDMPWYAWVAIAWVLVMVLSYFSVDVGAKLLGVLMSLELASLAITGVAVLAKGGAEGLDFGASFSPAAIGAGVPGIALSFAFASFIGFEATAIYGEEAKDPKRTVPLATYLAVGTITVLFALTSFAMVAGLGNSGLIDKVLEASGGLADPSAVLFSVASTYVGPWLADIMGFLVISSLFAGLLAFQNSSARYFYALGRAGVLPRKLDHVNAEGAPWLGSVVTGVITAVVIAYFVVANLDPFMNLFSWFSAVAVVAIVFVEILVCFAVVAYFGRTGADTRVWHTKIAPVVAALGLIYAEYLLMSRFGVLASTAPEGVDPTLPENAWALNTTGWVLVASSFVLFVIGALIGVSRKSSENRDLIDNLIS